MEDSPMQASVPALKRLAPFVAAVVIGGAGLGYAVHEHSAAQRLAAQNEQVNAALAATHSQLNDLAAKVNALASREATGPEPAPIAVTHHTVKPGAVRVPDHRLTKMQAQLDAQGKQIDETRGDLASTRTELTGSIAHTHDELVLLEKKGERSYYEFDLGKSKQFQREGPIEISLRKANQKNHYADLQLIVEDRTLTQKHVNAYQPVVFYSDKEQPIQVVINEVSKDHIHGYVSAPKYRQTELADAGTNAAAAPDAPPEASVQSAPRKKLPVPQPQ
jgi:hypothetical protein